MADEKKKEVKDEEVKDEYMEKKFAGMDLVKKPEPVKPV